MLVQPAIAGHIIMWTKISVNILLTVNVINYLVCGIVTFYLDISFSIFLPSSSGTVDLAAGKGS